MEDWAKYGKKYKEKINYEKEWNQMMEADALKELVKRVTREKIPHSMRKTKSGMINGSLQVSVANGEIGVRVMMDRLVLASDDGRMAGERKTSVSAYL